MMQNTVTGVILTIMSMILVTSFTPTRKLSITEMAVLSDQNAEILRFYPKFDVASGFPDIPEVVGAKTTEGSAEKAAGPSLRCFFHSNEIKTEKYTVEKN